jgi:hypothetical protein
MRIARAGPFGSAFGFLLKAYGINGVLLYNILKESGVASSFSTDYLVKKSGAPATISVFALSCQRSALSFVS